MEAQLGVPLNRLRVEEAMAHVKRGARGRADIVVYRDDEKNKPLMVIECKAPEVDISCDDVREQAERYRNILKADYIMLVNGYKLIIYKYQDGKNFELVDISSYKELLESKVSFVENIQLNHIPMRKSYPVKYKRNLPKYMLDVRPRNLLNFLQLIF